MVEIIKMRVRSVADKKLHTDNFLFESEPPKGWFSYLCDFLDKKYGHIYSVDKDKCSRFVVDYVVNVCDGSMMIKDLYSG